MPTTVRRRVGQQAKRPVDPAFGQRIRSLREARGLTQEQLAGRDYSKGFISLIETGRTRVSLRAAEVLASRLGASVADLMAPGGASGKTSEVKLLRAEAAIAGGDTKAALSLTDGLAKTLPVPLRVRSRRVRGRALVLLGRAREGVADLEEALREARQTQQGDLIVRLLYDLTQAHEVLDEPGEVVAFALECDARLQAGQLVDRTLELQVRASLAMGFTRLGDARSAQAQADRALEIAADVSDKRALAGLYSTLTIARQEGGDLEAALLYAHRALAAMEALGQSIAVVAALNNVAWIHSQRGEHRRADEVLDRATKLAESERLDAMRPALLSTRAETRLAQGQPAEALELAGRAADPADANGQTRGQALLICAQAMGELDRPGPEVRGAFERAIAALRGRSARLQARAHRAFADYLARHERSADAYAEAQKALALLDPALN